MLIFGNTKFLLKLCSKHVVSEIFLSGIPETKLVPVTNRARMSTETTTKTKICTDNLFSATYASKFLENALFSSVLCEIIKGYFNLWIKLLHLLLNSTNLQKFRKWEFFSSILYWQSFSSSFSLKVPKFLPKGTFDFR